MVLFDTFLGVVKDTKQPDAFHVYNVARHVLEGFKEVGMKTGRLSGCEDWFAMVCFALHPARQHRDRNLEDPKNIPGNRLQGSSSGGRHGSSRRHPLMTTLR